MEEHASEGFLGEASVEREGSPRTGPDLSEHVLVGVVQDVQL